MVGALRLLEKILVNFLNKCFVSPRIVCTRFQITPGSEIKKDKTYIFSPSKMVCSVGGGGGGSGNQNKQTKSQGKSLSICKSNILVKSF